MGIEYDGECAVEIDGKEVDVISIDYTIHTGRKPVRTMNRTARPKGSVSGAKSFDLKITAPAPATGEYPWSRMKDAQIVIYPVGNPTKRTTLRGCNVTDNGARYQLDGEMVRDITGYCLDLVEPQ